MIYLLLGAIVFLCLYAAAAWLDDYARSPSRLRRVEEARHRGSYSVEYWVDGNPCGMFCYSARRKRWAATWNCYLDPDDQRYSYRGFSEVLEELHRRYADGLPVNPASAIEVFCLLPSGDKPAPWEIRTYSRHPDKYPTRIVNPPWGIAAI